MSPIRKVLILCLGNICRSPYGAARLAGMGEKESDLEVKSAGLMGSGNPSPETARSVAEEKGLDLNAHRSQLLDRELAAWADLSVVMTKNQANTVRTRFGVPPERVVLLGDLDPGEPESRDIPDPLDKDSAFFRETFDRMDRCLSELYSLLRG